MKQLHFVLFIIVGLTVGCASRRIQPAAQVDNTLYYTYDSARFKDVIGSAVTECAKVGKKPDMDKSPTCVSISASCFRGMCAEGGAECTATFACK